MTGRRCGHFNRPADKEEKNLKLDYFMHSRSRGIRSSILIYVLFNM